MYRIVDNVSYRTKTFLRKGAEMDSVWVSRGFTVFALVAVLLLLTLFVDH